MEFKEVSDDNRRTIYANDKLLEDNKEVSIIHLKKGKAIGGCVHSKDENMFIISGSFVFCDFGDGWEIHKEGYGKIIKARTPHAFMAPMEDCIIIESGITKKDKDDSVKVNYMLDEVNRINGKNYN